MITPTFNISQNEESLSICIQAPYCSLSVADIFIEGTDFKFYAKPYFLRLNLPGCVVEDDKSTCFYDCDSGQFTIKVSKETKGEYFKDLNLLTKLLTPAPVLNENKQVKSIEVIASEDYVQENSNEDFEPEEYDWYFEQHLPNIEENVSLNTFAYGFANQKNNVFMKLGGDPFEALCLKNPDKKKPYERRYERIQAENEKFDSDYYLSDLYENEYIKTILQFNSKLTNKLTENENNILLNLPKNEYLLESTLSKLVYFSLVDLLFAYSYDNRCTEGEDNVESAWNIRTLSATLSWCENYTSLKDTLTTCYRRSLCYPLFRHWEIAKKCHEDVCKIMELGKTQILKSLLHIHKLFSLNQQFNLLNQLYITDYAVWIQNIEDHVLVSLTNAIKKCKITKEDMNLELIWLEQAAELVLQGNEEEDSIKSSESETDSSSSGYDDLESNKNNITDVLDKLKNIQID